MIKYLIIFSLITNISYAQEAVFLNKDDKSPYSGYLLPQEKLVELRNNTLERNSLKLQNDSLNRSISLQDSIIAKKTEQVGILLDQNDKLAKTAYSAQSLSNWERAGYFALGVIITGFIAYGTVQTLR